MGKAKWNFGSFYLWGDVPALMPIVRKASKNNGGSWFAIAHNTKSGHSQNAREQAVRQISKAWRDKHYEKTDKAALNEGVKQSGISGKRANGKGDRWFQDGAARSGSKSSTRKAASAQIAKIPLVLSRHIAAWWKPETQERVA